MGLINQTDNKREIYNKIVGRGSEKKGLPVTKESHELVSRHATRGLNFDMGLILNDPSFAFGRRREENT